MNKILSSYCMALLFVSILSVFGSYAVYKAKESALMQIQTQVESKTEIMKNKQYMKLRAQFNKQRTQASFFHVIYGILITGLVVILFIYKKLDKAKEIKNFARLGKELHALSLHTQMKKTIIKTNQTENPPQ